MIHKMSEKKRQRSAKKAQVVNRRNSLSGRVVVLVVVAALAVFAWSRWPQPGRNTIQSQQIESTVERAATVFKQPSAFLELCNLPAEQLVKCDIALMNLLCAEGLPGAENLNVREILERLDGIAQGVKFEIDRHLYKFRQNPAEFKNLEGYYRMMMMATVLQQDLGIRYNPERIQFPNQPLESNEKFFANSQDVFIHGLAKKNGMGTCSSMPVFYVAVGRRLGYPLKLVTAKGPSFRQVGRG